MCYAVLLFEAWVNRSTLVSISSHLLKFKQWASASEGADPILTRRLEELRLTNIGQMLPVGKTLTLVIMVLILLHRTLATELSFHAQGPLWVLLVLYGIFGRFLKVPPTKQQK